MSEPVGGTTAGRAAGLLCPNCRVNLVMSERQGVEIDYCPQCRGVWLDRGELDKILERSAAELSAASQPQPSQSPQPPAQAPLPDYRRDFDRDRDYDRDRDHYRHGEYKHHKRRKSFLEDLFD